MTDPIGSDDDVSIDELREAVEHMHGVPARYVQTVEVDERFKRRRRVAGRGHAMSKRSPRP